MTPDRWQQVKGIFDQAIACEPEQRDAFVRDACAGDAELYGEVASLVGSYDSAGTFFDKPVAAAAAAAVTASGVDPMIGRTFGVYKIVREIGRGGMGSVYLATRIDDQFRRRVALKAIKPELADEHALRRFRNERQALAVLDHPNIIKLLDGGQSDDGVPYLVMDYVEGVPIDEHCASHKLTVGERLELFRTVCAAVHYAHQNLVVHRDLKPGNILVTPDGVPKLLDFGIAKLLRPEYSAQAIGLTRTRLQPMTPKYASPEQVMGQPITTASDIYALGVVLYELLTGHHPFEQQVTSELELEKAIVGRDPERPSVAVTHAGGETAAMLNRFRESRPESLARALSGDLDMIVLKAMRKEPQRRYASVEHLSEDVRRHVEGLPVLARKGTLQYRLGKFVRRHRMGVAAGALVAGALVMSVALVYRAERRTRRMLDDLRRFNHFVVKDLDDMLRAGGATPAREMMLSQSVKSLDRLAADAKGDASLQQDLIDAYIRMGDAQGNFFVGNLGEKKEAAESYRKALGMAEALSKARPRDVGLRQQVADVGLKLADVLPTRKAMLDRYREAAQIYAALPADDKAVQNTLLNTWTKMGSIEEQRGDPAGALETYRRCRDYAHEHKRAPAEAVCQQHLAYFMALNGETAGGEDTILQSLRFYELHGMTRRQAQGLKALAEVQRRMGKLPEAIASVRRSLKISSDLLAEDPKNKLYQIDYGQAAVTLVSLLEAGGHRDEQRAETAQALKTMRPWLDRPDVDYQLQDYVELLVTTPFAELQNPRAALHYAEKAVAMTGDPDPNALDMLARAYDRNGDEQRAAEAERKAIALLPQNPSEYRTALETNLRAFESRSRQKQ